MYEILIFLRIYLAGITFSIYCFYRKNPKQATFIGSLVYIFAGWTIYASMKHPYFSNPMIYLPLVLMGIEKVYKKREAAPFYLCDGCSGNVKFLFLLYDQYLHGAVCGISVFRFIPETFRERCISVVPEIYRFLSGGTDDRCDDFFACGDDFVWNRTFFRHRIMSRYFMTAFTTKNISAV